MGVNIRCALGLIYPMGTQENLGGYRVVINKIRDKRVGDGNRHGFDFVYLINIVTMMNFLNRMAKICQSCGMTILFLGCGALSTQALPTLVSLKFPQAPEKTSSPGATSGGGVRSGGGKCLQTTGDKPSLKALIPGFIASPQTTSPTPTLYFYVPDNQGLKGEFFVNNVIGDRIALQAIKLGSSAGVMPITFVPSTPLDVNESYYWTLRVMCDPADPTQDVLLKGSFELIDRPANLPPIPDSINPAPQTLAIAEQYAKSGLWLDTLNLLSLVYETQPQEWQEFLESGGLADFMGAPLQPCCPREVPQ